jgi:hypothetical protein
MEMITDEIVDQDIDVTVTGIVENKNDIKAPFPNPTNGEFTLQWPNSILPDKSDLEMPENALIHATPHIVEDDTHRKSLVL